MTKMFKHQQEGINYGLKNDNFLLADEQGLGKTAQALLIACERKKAGQISHCLIVCGVNSIKHNWLAEIAKHTNEEGILLGGSSGLPARHRDLLREPKEFFWVINVESFRNKEFALDVSVMSSRGTIGLVIFDECHKACNSQTQQSKGMMNILSDYKIAMTGTPVMNKPLDLFNTLKWLGHEKLSYYGFRNRYCVMGGYGGYQVVAYKNLPELKSKVDKIMIRRLKKDVLDLPDKIRTVEYVELTAKQRQLYNEVKRGILDNLSGIKLSPNPLTQLIRLRQVTNSSSILSESITDAVKIERLRELVDELLDNGEKVVVFSNWTATTDIIQQYLKGLPVGVITGQTKPEDRQTIVDSFQATDKYKVLVGTIGSLGTGLTLTASSNVIFTDLPWTAAGLEQAEDRCHRIGQSGTVNITYLTAKNTIDERIIELVNGKAELSKYLLDGIEVKNQSKLIDYLLS